MKTVVVILGAAWLAVDALIVAALTIGSRRQRRPQQRLEQHRHDLWAQQARARHLNDQLEAARLDRLVDLDGTEWDTP